MSIERFHDPREVQRRMSEAVPLAYDDTGKLRRTRFGRARKETMRLDPFRREPPALEGSLNESRQATYLSRRFGGLMAGSGAAIAAALAQSTPAVPQARRGPRPRRSPEEDALEWNRAYMTRLNADRLLYTFRQNTGLDVRGAQPLGGWEALPSGSQTNELRGHFTGHFLSASAQLGASAGDQEADAKADYMVDELAKAQQRLGGAYLSAFSTEPFEQLDKISVDPETVRIRLGGPRMPWAPFYTIHKIIAGMLDMHRLAGNKQALEVAVRMAEWADRYSGSKSEAHLQEIRAEEFGGMADSLYSLSAAMMDDCWARVGDRFTTKRIANPLGLQRDALRGLHVNTHVPQGIAVARRYEVSGDVRFHDVADFFWDAVTGARLYVTTGTNNAETWQAEPRRLTHESSEGRTPNTAECRCSYYMFKLSRHLYPRTASPR